MIGAVGRRLGFILFLAGSGSPAAAQSNNQPLADWQLNPLPTLQGEWEHGDPEHGGPSKIRITDRKIIMVVPLDSKGGGNPFHKVPAGATAMDITRWGPDSSTGSHQVRLWGTCYDYTNSNGRPWDCWHILTKYSPESRGRTGRSTAWGIAGYERYRDEGAASAGSQQQARQPAPRLPNPETRVGRPVEADRPAEQTALAPSSQADEEERRRTGFLNERIATDRAAQLAENVARRQQYADAQAAHQRQVEAAEAERRAHEQEIERKLREIAEFQRGLEAYQQSLKQGGFSRAEAQANAERAETQLKAARAEEARLAVLKKKADERNAPVDFKEGIVLCEKPASGGRSWRCQGPLQVTYGELDAASGKVALAQACGSDRSIRDMGSAGTFRAFGCGFGIHPTAADYPGNIDVPVKLGVDVAGRLTFRCPRSKLAYCRGN